MHGGKVYNSAIFVLCGPDPCNGCSYLAARIAGEPALGRPEGLLSHPHLLHQLGVPVIIWFVFVCSFDGDTRGSSDQSIVWTPKAETQPNFDKPNQTKHVYYSLLVVDARHHLVVFLHAVRGHRRALEEGQDDQPRDPQRRHDVVPLRQVQRALCVEVVGCGMREVVGDQFRSIERTTKASSTSTCPDTSFDCC
jgi:hypothetical protein